MKKDGIIAALERGNSAEQAEGGESEKLVSEGTRSRRELRSAGDKAARGERHGQTAGSARAKQCGLAHAHAHTCASVASAAHMQTRQ